MSNIRVFPHDEDETLTIAGIPTVQPSVADSDDPELTPDIQLVFEELQFQCSFNEASSELFYDVKWYINNLDLGFEQIAVPGHNLSAAILRELHWRDRFNMGMKVSRWRSLPRSEGVAILT